jgi:GNAT superfamily N-acetyltransferase
MLEYGFHDIPPGSLPVVVTYLEMAAAAPQRPVPLPDDLSFDQIEPDLDRYRDLFRRVGGLEWLWSSRLEKSDADLTRIIRDPKVEIYTLTRKGVDEAILELDFRQQGDCELAFFGVTPGLIGSGAGRFLMNRAIELAWAKPIKRFHVHTCTIDSPQALAFYRRSGFRPYKQQVEICRDPRLQGHLPETAGPHVPIFKP